MKKKPFIFILIILSLTVVAFFSEGKPFHIESSNTEERMCDRIRKQMRNEELIDKTSTFMSVAKAFNHYDKKTGVCEVTVIYQNGFYGFSQVYPFKDGVYIGEDYWIIEENDYK